MACACCLLILEAGLRYGSSFRSPFVLGSSPGGLLAGGGTSLVRSLVLVLSVRLTLAGLAYVRTSAAQRVPLFLRQNILLGNSLLIEFIGHAHLSPSPSRHAEKDQRQASEQS